MVKNIRHTGIVINDLNASLHFYEELLGFKPVRRMEESGNYIDQILALHNAKVTTVKMVSQDGQMIELLWYHSHTGKQEPRHIYDAGLTHIACTVDDLDSEYNRLKAEGVVFNDRPRLSPDGYARVSFCRAPEGTLIELVEIAK